MTIVIDAQLTFKPIWGKFLDGHLSNSSIADQNINLSKSIQNRFCGNSGMTNHICERSELDTEHTSKS